nr:MAG TPA: hypothetical protein [Caudoviricetes sp.]
MTARAAAAMWSTSSKCKRREHLYFAGALFRAR